MKKILIVEDEIAYMKLLHDQLTAQGYIVVEAANGKEGLEVAKGENPDIILLDIRMPVMDGITMLSLLRKIEGNKKTKVILLTNLEPEGKILERVVEDTPAYYFVKSDIELNDLLVKIKDLLAN